jgi:hypothetical protein
MRNRAAASASPAYAYRLMPPVATPQRNRALLRLYNRFHMALEFTPGRFILVSLRAPKRRFWFKFSIESLEKARGAPQAPNAENPAGNSIHWRRHYSS